MKMSEETIVVILEEKPRGNTGAVVRVRGGFVDERAGFSKMPHY